MPAADVQELPRARPRRRGDQRRQRRHVAVRRARVEPGPPRRRRGHLPDAERRQPALAAPRRELLDAVGRGEEQTLDPREIERPRQRRDRDQRRDDDAEPPRQPRLQHRGEGLRLRPRAGEEQGPRLGHPGSITASSDSAAVAPRAPRCYLPRSPGAIGEAGCGTQRVILGIESSCDDTAVAVIRARPGQPVGQILASEVIGQDALHNPYGGVVPEIAARAHAERLDTVTVAALAQAGIGLADLDAVAVTAGPGLIGGVLAGVMFAKGLAAGLGLPLWGVNHLAGHALTPRLIEDIAFPYLMLLVSGGHCQFLAVDGPERFRRLGGTIDDAPGEAFDKVAKLLGLGQPGGPAVEAEAAAGDPRRFGFPRPLLDRDGCDLSFSGLKTAVRRARDKLAAAQGGLTRADRADLCAGFQAAVAETLAEKTRRALTAFRAAHPAAAPVLAVAGGVAANRPIRAALAAVADAGGAGFLAPPLALCTDNGAMIAWAAAERMAVSEPDGLSLSARPRWPLDATAAPMLGTGRKGAKA